MERKRWTDDDVEKLKGHGPKIPGSQYCGRTRERAIRHDGESPRVASFASHEEKGRSSHRRSGSFEWPKTGWATVTPPVFVQLARRRDDFHGGILGRKVAQREAQRSGCQVSRRCYDRHSYADEDKRIMAAVARHIISIVDGKTISNVVALTGSDRANNRGPRSAVR